MNKKLKIAIPKGSLQEQTARLFQKAGFDIRISSYNYFPVVDDPQIEAMLVRAQEIPRYVENGIVDMGITGHDWVIETKANVTEVDELIYARGGMNKVRWVLAVPENSPIQTVKDLEGKIVATELVQFSKNYLEKEGVHAKVEFSWGATEIKPPYLADAIIEITETGSTLRANKLRIIQDILESTTRIIANHESWKDEWKREKIQNIVMLLKAALAAEGKVGLLLNVEEKNLEPLIKILPALKKPTISRLTEPGWYSISTIAEEKVVRELIPKLKKMGATGIVEFPLNKVLD
ncbi:MAG: ATP phosphoribosyltransferase [Candidatus Diapherotrites archaeon]|uniref:ATP phosphoribosyltransferase n=1 Tax=Candidatus Iainarchaeum sp. TaxID=3101447 RepID=A0A8T4L8L6_9ARCH|nr:ATP phosphoribosyltransferase [Candidatus Diapherotrites archaeon]